MNLNIVDIFYHQSQFNRKISKLVILICVSIFFSLIYFFIPDSEFGGINKFQELVRDELIKKKLLQNYQIQKTFKIIPYSIPK